MATTLYTTYILLVIVSLCHNTCGHSGVCHSVVISNTCHTVVEGRVAGQNLTGGGVGLILDLTGGEWV